MEVKFVPKRFPVVAGPWIRKLLPKGEVDEWGAKLEVELTGDSVRVGHLSIPLSELDILIKEMKNVLYAIVPEGLLPLVRRDVHFYKLRALEEPEPPTLEIDGVHMHRIAEVDPWKDALTKVRAAKVKKNDLVLDTCMGLGYTAIASIKRGAKVITVEKDANVIELAQWNPWSWELEKATVFNDDVFKLIKEFEDESFDKVIHDPPVMSMAGELYSQEFYEELHRILKPGGVLFHYTGNPKRRSGVDLARGVMERLRRAGFDYVKRVPQALGVVARKMSS